MTLNIDQKLEEMGFSLPSAPAPAANYVPFVQVGSLLFVSGQISIDADGSLITGKLGAELGVEAGAKAAQRCGLSLLAQVKAASGDFSTFKRVIKLTGFVNSTADFTEQPKVINGCSDFLVEVLGDAGRHSRSAVSAGSLPLGVAVEIEGIFELL